MLEVGDSARRTGLTGSLMASLGLFVLFIGLGVWQLDRAAQKRAIHERQLQRTADTQVNLNEFDQRYLDPSYMVYRRVRLSGCFDVDTVLFVDNRVLDGRVGYEVVSPFRIGCDRAWVLVNRGWVPASMDRGHVPQIDTPAGAIDISGMARAPSRPGLLFGEPYVENVGAHQYRVQTLAMGQMQELIDRPLRDYVVALDSGSPAGFVRSWPQAGSGAERHVAYAVQWFGIALAWLVVTLVVRARTRAGSGS